MFLISLLDCLELCSYMQLTFVLFGIISLSNCTNVFICSFIGFWGQGRGFATVYQTKVVKKIIVIRRPIDRASELSVHFRPSVLSMTTRGHRQVPFFRSHPPFSPRILFNELIRGREVYGSSCPRKFILQFAQFHSVQRPSACLRYLFIEDLSSAFPFPLWL